MNMPIAIALDRKNTVFKEQAFLLTQQGNGNAMLRFLMPEKIEKVLLKKPWHLKEGVSNKGPSGLLLKNFMIHNCFVDFQKPGIQKDCLSFDLQYDADFNIASARFGNVTTSINGMDFFKANTLLHPNNNTPLALEVKRLREFSKSVMKNAGREMRPNSNAEWVNQCISTEVNKGFDKYLRNNALTGFAKTQKDGELVCNPEKFYRGSSYGHEVDQYYNLVQCLYHANFGKGFLDDSACHDVVKTVNLHDRRVIPRPAAAAHRQPQ